MQRRACPATVIVRVTWPHEGGRRRWEAGEGGAGREKGGEGEEEEVCIITDVTEPYP